MRFIPTSASTVDTLKKQAKRLQRNGGGKHADLLDRVARAAGYNHWHHVTLCFRESSGITASRGLGAEVESIIRSAVAGEERAVITGPEALASQPFVLLATQDGDAWILDPEGDRLLCLAWHGERQPFVLRDLPTRIEIEWDGHFELLGQFFAVQTQLPNVGTRHIIGYPVERLRELLDATRSADRRIEQLFGAEDAVPLTDDVVAQLVRADWDPERLATAARQRAKYSPSRDSLLFPPVTNL